jgi:glycosyltransferase involved in cell wall biosynthesis
VRFSVVITCYDQARFIGEAARSALDQEPSPAEVVVVDDGSPSPADVTAALDGLDGLDAAQLLRQANQGVGAARNTGLAATTGDAVVFLDGDDRLRPGALAAAGRALAEHPSVGLVSGHARLIDAAGNELHDSVHPCADDDHYAALLRHTWIHPPGSAAFRRAALESAGPWSTDPGHAMVEDLDLYLRVARRHEVRCHHELVVDYRQHGGNASHRHGWMLGQVLQRLSEERELVAGDAHLVAACDEGAAHWKDLMGGWLLWDVKGRLRSPRRWPSAARDLAVLARLAPGVLTSRVRHRLPRRLQRRP